MFFRKPKKQVPMTTQEKMDKLIHLHEIECEKIEADSDKQIRMLRETYESKMDEEKNFEKDLSLPTILFEAENGTHPLEYSIVTRRGKDYKEVIFKRGKRSPNPYEITVEDHKNQLFLFVTLHRKTHAKDSVLTLHYDKMKNIFTEFQFIPCDYATKHQMRMFLYDLMKHVKEESFHLHDKYMSEFKARDLFWSKKHPWKDTYEREVKRIKQEKEIARKLNKEKLGAAIAPLKQIVEKQKKKKTERLVCENSSVASPYQEQWIKENVVYDEEIVAKMKAVYHQARSLMQKRSMLDIENSYLLERLYERDIQEAWEGYVGLDRRKQKAEKSRFLLVLSGIEILLNGFEERIKRIDEVDYERKMLYMEQTYLSAVSD